MRAGRGTTAAINILLVVGVLGAGLLALEYVSRWLLPVARGTQFLAADGHPALLVDGAYRLFPNVTFRQISPDFDVVGHTGPRAMRAPEPDGLPNIVFLGDSFTFGQGLSDEQTFVARYCTKAALACANLGRLGTGTYVQTRMLELRLRDENWRPTEVKLFVFAMASSLMLGNDFLDTLNERAALAGGDTADAEAAAVTIPEEANPGLLPWLVAQRRKVLASSNLARIVYGYIGPALRVAFSPTGSAGQLQEAVAAMREEMDRLRALAAEFGFTYTIYVVHPVQDLVRGSYPETLAAVREAAGDARVVSTAAAFLHDPVSAYFPYDGHINASGAARIAAFLEAEGQAGRTN